MQCHQTSDRMLTSVSNETAVGIESNVMWVMNVHTHTLDT